MTSHSTELELAIVMVVNKFCENAKHGNHKMMNLDEYSKMISQELPHLLTNSGDKEAVKKEFEDLDKDKDGKIDFDGYWDWIGSKARSRPVMTSNSTELESAIVTMVDHFYKYAKHGKDDKMNFDEYNKMISQELQNVLTNVGDKEVAKRTFERLKKDKDGKIDFDAYWDWIGHFGKNMFIQMTLQYQE